MVKRFTTFVIATSPTFWLKEVIGIHPKTEDSALMNPSQAIDPEISFCSAFLPRAVAASAEVSPIVSVADTRKINVTETIALRLNSGGKWHKGRKRYDRSFLQRGKVNHPHKNSQNITDDQSEKDGELLPVRLRKDVEQDAAQQCHGSEDQVLRGAERRAAAAAAEGCRAHGEQGEADGGDDAGRDNRSDDLCPVFGEKSQKTFN